MLHKPFFIFSFSIIALVLYLVLSYIGDFRSNIFQYLIIVASLFAVYVIFVYLALSNENNLSVHWGWFILFAILARLILFPSTPLLSDDVYRFFWDGKVSAHGINPYRYAPVCDELSSLRDNEIYPNINFPEIATVYPPLAQFLFLINEWLGGLFISWKIILLMFEAMLILILLKLIKHFSLGEHRIIIFICNPLVIIETYHSGHFDIIALMFFWLAILIFYKQRDRLFLGVLVMAILVKFLPLLMALPMLIKKFWRKLLLIIFAVTIILVPFSLNQTIPVAGFFSYANRWAFNSALFNLITELIDLFDFRVHEIATISLSGHTEIFYINKQFYYKIFALIVLLFIIYDQMRKLRLTSTYRSINYIQASFIITAALLLLVPTLHPWYIIIIIPFLIFTPNWSWLVFTFLVQLSYFVLQDYALMGVWQESKWVLLAEYLPFYGLLIFEYLDKRKIKGWFSE